MFWVEDHPCPLWSFAADARHEWLAWVSVSKLSSGLVYEPGIARFIRNFASEAADLAREWLQRTQERLDLR